MAKKKKAKSKDSKKDEKSTSAPEGFWQQVVVIFLLLLALLLAFGSIGTGGVVSETLFEWSRWLLGYIAYLLPVFLVFAAIKKQRGENHRMPRQTLFGLLILIASLAGIAHLGTDSEISIQTVEDGNGGGMVGHIIASAIWSLFNTVLGAVLLSISSIVALHFIMGWPLNSFMRLLRVEKRKELEPADEKKEEKKEEESKFTLNEGVPVQKSKRGLKKAAAVAAAKETHDALTTSGDPNWKLPPVNLLSDKQDKADAGDVEGNADVIKETLSDFNINVDMQGANIGPRVTQFTLKPPSGVRLTKITALENNIALNLAATSIRMEAPIPGKRAVGIEVPNIKAASVNLRGIFDSAQWKGIGNPLGFAVGRDISGEAVVADLGNMPHLLIAGSTGSGKSVMINGLLSSLLYRNSPADLKLIMVDPKEVELTPYNDIPHLLTPVITEPEKCISALKWATAEMDRRYSLMREAGKRNIADYNKLKKEEGMPYIVIIIDELADLMMLAARDVEALIVRLAQKARAVGIHLVLATQRPSVDVITGLIKTNVPARIAFTVTSGVDSRTIIDQQGAEKLLGAGDMLYKTANMPAPVRIQGVYIDDKEVKKLADFLREARAPEYDDEITAQPVQLGGKGGVVASGGMDVDDSLYEDAVRVVVESGKASASLLQRRLRVGYARAARLIEAMEEQGIVGPADGARPRDVLISSMDDFNASRDSEV